MKNQSKTGDSSTPLLCPYCGSTSEQVTGKVIYPHRLDLHGKVFYQCRPCGAYVGCHPGTSFPLGRLANAELRAAKISAHAAFDPLWRSPFPDEKFGSRKKAYGWLAEQLGIPRNDCHIGMFDVETCHEVVKVCGA
jgi:hypothetical protein